MKKLTKSPPSASARDLRPAIHVIEDNEEELIFLCDFLTMSGFRVSGSTGADNALEYVAKMKPDVLLCSLIAPDVNGEEVVLRARKASPHTRILLTSEHLMVPLPERLRKAPGVDLLRGPRHAIGLLRAVQRLIDGDPEAESGE